MRAPAASRPPTATLIWRTSTTMSPSLSLSLLVLLCCRCAVFAAAAPLRLRVDGRRLVDPESGADISLEGFNWQVGRLGPDPGSLMKSLAPRANVARIVGVYWGNTKPLSHHPNKECMTSDPPHYFNDKCFEDLDTLVKSATDAETWVILAVRGEYVAGQDFSTDPGGSAFRNATLRNMMYAMWRHVAGHYQSWDRIAALEILSEPRDKTVDPAAVQALYEGGCAAIHAVDPHTPCMVGAAPYYKLWNFDERVILRNSKNVIYTFDYFNPDAFAFGQSAIPVYGVDYPCATLYDGWADEVCPTWNVTSSYTQLIPFNASWHAHNFAAYVDKLQRTYDVPVFMNQFEVVHGVAEAQGRFDYVRDLVRIARAQGVGFAWWTWAGGNDNGWVHGSSEMVFRWPNGSTMVDHAMLGTLFPSQR